MERESDFSSNRESIKLKEITNEVDKIRDDLGKPIDKGIKETVIFLTALGLRTDQSCEGHLDHGLPAPWVEIYPKEPDVKNWQENEVLRNRVLDEEKKLREKTERLLEDFYKGKAVDGKVKLGLHDIGYGFRIQSEWLTKFEEKKGKIDDEKIEASKKEMADFTNFLKESYFSGER